MNVSSIAEVVMKTFDSVLDTAFEGLDNSTIVDPHRCEVLKAIHSLLLGMILLKLSLLVQL
jgi:hypothetical protein